MIPNPQVQFTTFAFPGKTSQFTDWKAIVSKYLYHWPLFILGILTCLSIFYIYFRFSKPTYEIKATFLIKDDKKIPDQQSALSEIKVLSSSKLLENEIEILKSRQLISQVIDDLGLSIVYETIDGLDSKILYKSSPIKLILLNGDTELEPQEIKIRIKNKSSFIVIEDGGNSKLCDFKTIINNKGTWSLEANKNISQFIGREIRIAILNPEELALKYQKKIEIGIPNKLATAVVLSLDDINPRRGKDVLNQLILNYNIAGTTEKEIETKNTIDFLDQRLISLAAELNEAEETIEGFKSSRGLTDISSKSKISLENMQVNDNRLNDVNIQLTVIEGIERYINSVENWGKTPATLGIVDPGLSSLIEKLSLLKLQRDKLLATTPETNPDFEPLNMQILNTRNAIKENIKSIKITLINTRSKLLSFNAGIESSIKNIPVEERQLVNIKRQQEIKENLFTYLLQKKEEISMNYANTILKDGIVDQAYVGPAKGPTKPLALGLAFIMGLVIPTGLIYARGKVNNTVVDIQEVSNIDLPIIGEIPYNKSLKLLPIVAKETNALSEQFRSLRTNLYYLPVKKSGGRVILVTSSIGGEGKSFVSSNLALTLSHMGRKIIILDVDLRKPKLGEIFQLKNEQPGISEFLAQKATIMEIIQQSGLDKSLHIINSGQITYNSSELLENSQFSTLISNLKGLYDDIIIDSPPVHLIPDAMILSRFSDITLYIIKQGYTTKAELDYVKALESAKRLPGMQIVFNGVQKARYGYGNDYNSYLYNPNETPSFISDFWKRF